MKIVAIAAMDKNRLIGNGADIPWYISEDFKFFKRQTLGFPVIMGRKTFESIGKPLPKRDNYVLTRQEDWRAEGVLTFHDKEVLRGFVLDCEKVFVIGGSEIYEEFLPWCDELIISHIEGDYEGDTYFPDYSAFQEQEVLFEGEDFTAKRYTQTNVLDKVVKLF